MSRPPKLDEDLIRKFSAAVSIGARPDQVARALGIGKSTFYGWISRGKAPGPGDHVYVDFVETISKARGSAYVTLIADLRNIAKRDPRAAIKLLETIDKEWGAAANGGASVGTAAPTIQIVVERKEPKGSGAQGESGEPEPDNRYGADATSPSPRTRVIIDVGPHEPNDAESEAVA